MGRVAYRIAWSLLAVGMPAAVAFGQGIIGVTAGTSISARVAPGARVAVPIALDMAAASAGISVGSVVVSVRWSASRLALDSVKAGSFGVLTSDVSGAASGLAMLTLSSQAGTTASVLMGTLFFTASAGTGGTRLQLSPIAATDASGTDLLASTLPRNLDVCVAPAGIWGDVNGDSLVNIIDAQQIARFSVGLGVLNAAALGATGDVTGDGVVNIIDAQQVARFTVGLAAVQRVNVPLFVPSPVALLSISPSLTSITAGVSVQFTGTPTDAASADLTGCTPVAWATNNPSVATVTPTGVVRAVGAGTAVITGTAGGQSAQRTLAVGSSASAAQLAIVSGAGQFSTAGTALGQPLTVIVRDSAGRPLPARK